MVIGIAHSARPSPIISRRDRGGGVRGPGPHDWLGTGLLRKGAAVTGNSAEPAGGPAAGPARPAEVTWPASTRQRRRAAGIYGTIITAAVMAAAGSRLPTLELEVSILITLLVYWVAEVYAHLLGGQLERGHLPSVHQIHLELTATWTMVSASFLPLIVLLLVRGAGTTAPAAANAGLISAVLLLVLYGWSAGRAAGLRGMRLVLVAAIAAALGLLMILLKNLVLVHMH